MTTEHMWAGALTDTSVAVRARMSGAGTSVRLAVSLSDTLSSPTYFGPVVGTADNVVAISATGLSAGTRYYYAMEDAGVLDTACVGSVRTHPVAAGQLASYTFGLAGDSGLTGAGDDSHITSQVSNNPVFDTMRVQSASDDWAWFSHLGDLHYRNIATADSSLYRAAFNDVHTYNGTLGTSARQGRFLRGQAVTYVWDDHDFGPNDSDSTDLGNADANAVYRERVPSYALDASGIYQSWQAGRVLYIASDVRTFRSPNSDPAGPAKTMLGATQKSWMENILTVNAGAAEALVWISPSRWIGGTDTWSSFEDERDEMVTMFGDLEWLDKMLYVTADEHALGICSAANNDFGGFPMFMVASMDSSFTTATDDNSAIYEIGRKGGRQQYGTIEVIDSGHMIQLKGTGYINGAAWASFDAFVEEPVTTWQAGMRITAGRLMDETPDEEVTTGLTAETNWSVAAFQGRKKRGIIYLNLFITKTGGTVSSGTDSENIIGDPTIATLPVGWRPSETVGVSWDNGSVNGQGTIDSNGAVKLRTISYNQSITDTTNVRIATSFIP